MKYTVLSILEDIDFGCEERKEGTPLMALVVLKAEDGKQMEVRQEDQMLYDRDINEGDLVIFDQDGKLRKAE